MGLNQADKRLHMGAIMRQYGRIRAEEPKFNRYRVHYTAKGSLGGFYEVTAQSVEHAQMRVNELMDLASRKDLSRKEVMAIEWTKTEMLHTGATESQTRAAVYRWALGQAETEKHNPLPPDVFEQLAMGIILAEDSVTD